MLLLQFVDLRACNARKRQQAHEALNVLRQALYRPSQHCLVRPIQLAHGLVQRHPSRHRQIQGAHMRLCDGYSQYLAAALLY